jgi:hypothetical protein
MGWNHFLVKHKISLGNLIVFRSKSLELNSSLISSQSCCKSYKIYIFINNIVHKMSFEKSQDTNYLYSKIIIKEIHYNVLLSNSHYLKMSSLEAFLKPFNLLTFTGYISTQDTFLRLMGHLSKPFQGTGLSFYSGSPLGCSRSQPQWKYLCDPFPCKLGAKAGYSFFQMIGILGLSLYFSLKRQLFAFRSVLT